ncbi:MAG: HAMP domain-containing sensor histidine kinase [Zhongshania sp.]|uniref:sensor histidine kinase n=1 Tax=Zhongshania sp. TaxID=1971902 RepID=UPI00260ADF3B|nr:HAMP domain-containing sensor histidine kinase [Zhongshania sp.]MDF1693515.1 HAMP domain-containing sensor histidine kinase [Zhongshania sp.]
MRLKLLAALSALGLLVVIVGGFSLLSAHYFIRGMDTIVAGQMEQAASRYIKSVPKAERGGLNTIDGYYFTSNWALMPPSLSEPFAQLPDKTDVLVKEHNATWLEPPRVVHFLLRHTIDGTDYFIARTLTRKDASSVIGLSAMRSKQLLAMVSVGTLIGLAFIIWLLSRRVTQPVSELVQWTRNLNAESLHESVPHFGFPELNTMAGLIRSSLTTVHDSLEREHHYQRHVSHELRTPISIIRSNINLLRKLEQQQQLNPAQLGPIVDRIDRASLTMKNLTHTLLWLSRDDQNESLPKTTVQLDQLLNDLVAESRYLMQDKAVQIDVQTQPFSIEIATEPARIVLANIIQNAFQHTWEGDVRIIQQAATIIVTNTNRHSDEAVESLGFGLGLRLVSELTTRMGWHYSNEAYASGHCVTINFATDA